MTRKRKRPPTRSKPVLASVTATSQMRRLYRECPDAHPEIWARWPVIAGDQIGRRTFPVRLINGVLSIGVSSSAWLQQISFLKENILNRIDEEIGPGVVTEIRLILQATVCAPGSREEKAIHPPKPRMPVMPIPADVRDMVARIEDSQLADALARAIVASKDRFN